MPGPPGSARAAGRAGLTLLVALGVLVACGRPQWAAYATFGAFASVYGGRWPRAGRWRSQTGMAGVLLGATTSGTAVATLDQAAWWSVAGAAGWAVAAAALSDRQLWRPPGPMFAVFAFATCAAIPASTHELGWAVVVCGATAALAVGLGRLEEVVGRPTVPWPPPPPHPAAASAARRRVHAMRCGVAVAVAGSAATALGIGRPSWAMVAAVVPLAAAPLRAQLSRGLHRAAGTVVGLGLAALLLATEPGAVATVVLVGLLQMATELVVAWFYAVALVFVTPLSLLVTQLGQAQPTGTLLTDRLLETVLGVGIGVAVAVLTRSRAARAHP